MLTKEEKIAFLEDFISCIYNETRPLFEANLHQVDEDVVDYWIDILVENPVPVKLATFRKTLFPEFEEGEE